MLLSNGTALTLIHSTIDSINACLLTHVVSEWEYIKRLVPRCIPYGLRIILTMMSCIPIFTPHTDLIVSFFLYGCDVIYFDKLPTYIEVGITYTCGCTLVNDV